MSARSLEQMVPTWEWVFGALSGEPLTRITLVENEDQIAGGDAKDRIRLPHEPPYQIGIPTLDWYRLALVHRAAHYEFGTFSFRLPGLDGILDVVGAEDDVDGRGQHERESDLEYVLAHLSEWHVAERIFTDLEDLRIERKLARLYGGFREHLDAMQRAELQERDDLERMPPRRLAMELVCRRSLNWDLAAAKVPTDLVPMARTIDAAFADLARDDATVTDSVLWMVRSYRALMRLPSLSRVSTSFETVGPSGAAGQPGLDPLAWEPRVQLEGQEVLETPDVRLPRYRDGLGFRHSAQTTTGRMESASIFRFIPGSGQGRPDEPSVELTARGESGQERPQVPEPGEHEHYELVDHHYHPPVGRLRFGGGRSFLYPEWDHTRREYRAGWCRVRERIAATEDRDGDGIYRRVVRRHRGELSRLRKRAERLVHEGRKTVRRTKWGDDVDLDAAVEATSDLIAGLPPSPNVHISREPIERDVALVVLFDLSSSTAERIPMMLPDGTAEDVSVDTPLAMGSSKRILDIELESMALLMAAFAATGDQLGVYGFSSSGRGDVQFIVLKDLTERLASRVTRRLDGIKPIHSTRIGPAVRHATRKLQKAEASTRLLLLVCDGRPYDLDYAPDGEEFPDIAYAVADTRRALDEAAEGGLHVKVLGIDHNEQHFVREICGPRVAHELLPSVELLPQRMVSLSRDLLH